MSQTQANRMPRESPPGWDDRIPAGADPGALMALAEQLAREAGVLIEAGRPAQLRVLATKSSPVDVVTEMDQASEELIRCRLAQHRPQDGVHGEEQGVLPGSTGLTWVIDPIDGTVNYLYGLPGYVVSVAVAVGDTTVDGDWWPVAGCVYDPVTDRCWTAAAGRGAFLNGARLTVADPPPLSGTLLGTGFGYRAVDRAHQGQVVAALLPRVRDIRRLGAAAMDLCLVGSGQLDAFFHQGLSPWDLAAGILVAAEAGAQVRGIDSRPAGRHMVLVARPPLVDVLAAALEELEAAGPSEPGELGERTE